jgi:glutathione S-transferase
MSPVRIHGYLVSTWVRTVCMVCVEKGIDYELLAIAYGGPEHHALHPFAKIPVLQHDGHTVTESLSIVGYLDEAFDGPGLQPEDLDERTRMREWMGLCADYVYRLVVRGIPRARQPTDEELASARGVLEQVETLIGDGPFLVGQQISLADLYLAPQLSNVREKAPELLEPLVRSRRWLSSIESRPSFRQTSYNPAAL